MQTYLERDVQFLEITSQIIVVPLFYENFGKRLIKSPKLYFVDMGFACHLLGVDSETVLLSSLHRRSLSV